VSRPTRGQSRALPVRGCHPLWPAFPDGSGCRTIATGLVRVRSPLLTESLLMSFPPGTEMFQFPGFASYAYGFSARYRRSGGFPHSDIRGSKLVRNSPRLFAAYHVLHRLRVPRHPPNALKALDRSHCLMPAPERRGAGTRHSPAPARAGASGKTSVTRDLPVGGAVKRRLPEGTFHAGTSGQVFSSRCQKSCSPA
jgi:hypothetical protein